VKQVEELTQEEMMAHFMVHGQRQGLLAPAEHRSRVAATGNDDV